MAWKIKRTHSIGGGNPRLVINGKAIENITSPHTEIVTGPLKFEGSFELAYNTVLNSGHDNRYYGYCRGARWIGEWVYNVYGITQMIAHRDSDHSNYETIIDFPTSEYNGKTLKVYDVNGNLLWTFTISGSRAYADRHQNDPLGIRPAGMKYWNLVIE